MVVLHRAKILHGTLILVAVVIISAAIASIYKIAPISTEHPRPMKVEAPDSIFKTAENQSNYEGGSVAYFIVTSHESERGNNIFVIQGDAYASRHLADQAAQQAIKQWNMLREERLRLGDTALPTVGEYFIIQAKNEEDAIATAKLLMEKRFRSE